jgi:CHAD domain-containing protein
MDEIVQLPGSPVGPPVKASRAPWSAGELRQWDGETLLRRVVAACLEQIRPNAAAIAAGSKDPEHVHQLRVGLRRLRSAARGLAPFDARLPPGWESALTPVFDALGEARDRHVLATAVVPKLARAGAPPVGVGPPGIAALSRLVRGPRFQGLLERLSGFAGSGADGATDPGKDAGLDLLVTRLRKLARQGTRHARGFHALPFEAQHQVRKRLKRLRYLADFAAPAFGHREFKAWTAHVSKAQDALGHYVDLMVAARHFESVAATDPRAWFAVGWLRAKTKRAARKAREALTALRGADVFW